MVLTYTIRSDGILPSLLITPVIVSALEEPGVQNNPQKNIYVAIASH